MIDQSFAAVILASSLACIVTTIGIYVFSKYEAWGRNNIVYFMSFAAGVLISVSFMHIIPQSFQMNDAAPVYLLAGFLAFYLFNRFLNLYICHSQTIERSKGMSRERFEWLPKDSGEITAYGYYLKEIFPASKIAVSEAL